MPAIRRAVLSKPEFLRLDEPTEVVRSGVINRLRNGCMSSPRLSPLLLSSSTPNSLWAWRTTLTSSIGAGLLLKVAQRVDHGLEICSLNADSYQLMPSRRLACATDWMHSVILPSAFRVLARAKIDNNLNWAFSSARRTESRVGW